MWLGWPERSDLIDFTRDVMFSIVWVIELSSALLNDSAAVNSADSLNKLKVRCSLVFIETHLESHQVYLLTTDGIVHELIPMIAFEVT